MLRRTLSRLLGRRIFGICLPLRRARLSSGLSRDALASSCALPLRGLALAARSSGAGLVDILVSCRAVERTVEPVEDARHRVSVCGVGACCASVVVQVVRPIVGLRVCTLVSLLRPARQYSNGELPLLEVGGRLLLACAKRVHAHVPVKRGGVNARAVELDRGDGAACALVAADQGPVPAQIQEAQLALRRPDERALPVDSKCERGERDVPEWCDRAHSGAPAHAHVVNPHLGAQPLLD
mmetsp:Transcript_3267/g.8136  ORF Transcript_3267/g.8136 Transcript_3267/m.8136 type:complete len:239 (-) Transcript_3267:576-1292(-)